VGSVLPANATATAPGAGPGQVPAKGLDTRPAKSKPGVSSAAARPSSDTGPIPLLASGVAHEQGWQDYFAGNVPHPARVRELVLQFIDKRDHEQVIAVLEAAITAGQAQPWMYEALALTMDVVGRPREEVERVLLSNVDFSVVNVPNTLYSAAMLTRFDRKDRALALYRQAAKMDPSRAETYVLALKLAHETEASAEIGWSAAGVLAYVWTRDWQDRHREAEAIAKSWETSLRKTGRTKEADALSTEVAAGRMRDLDCELSWSGTGDLDLVIEEPRGSVCSFEATRTSGGGVHVHDGYGPDQKNTWERYVCPRGFAGDYRIRVRHMSGTIVGKRAILKVTRHAGTPAEKIETIPIPLDARERVVKISLETGRLDAPTPVVPDDAAARLKPVPQAWKQRLVAARQQRVNQAVAQQLAGAGAGVEPAVFAQAAGQAGQNLAGTLLPAGAAYQPVITVLSEGVTLSASAVVSADRRYVRLSLSPAFTALTDVFTFSFLSSGGGQGQGQGAGQRGGGGP
jgi:hypothetical protein